MSMRRSSTKQEPPDLTFFVDADLNDSVFHDRLTAAQVRFERHDAHFQEGAGDEEWLAKAGRLGWIVLTHNKRIRWNSGQTERLMAKAQSVRPEVGLYRRARRELRPDPA